MSSAEEASNTEMAGCEGADKKVNLERKHRMKFSLKFRQSGCSGTQINQGIHQAGADQNAQNSQQPIGWAILG